MARSRILIVEDDPDTARLLEVWLQDRGYTCAGTATSGKQAIALAASIRPDLVLMDIVLPGGMDGIEAADILKARFDLPVIYLTAYTDDALFARARETAPYAYLTKPFNERDLERAIETGLDRHALLRRLKAAEAHLAEAQAVAHLGSWRWDVPQDRVEASDELLRLLELSPGSFRPCLDSFLQCVSIEDRPKMRNTIDIWLRGDDPGELDVAIPRENGMQRMLRVVGKARFDADGKVVELLGTARDITREWAARQEAESYRTHLEDKVAQRTADLASSNDRLRAEIAAHQVTERALLQSEARYRSLVESLPDAVFVIQNDRVVYVNPSAVRLTGVQMPDDLLGKSVTDLMQPDTLQLYQQRKQAAFARKDPNPLIAYSVMRPDGSTVEVESLSFAFEFDGRPAFLTVVRDLTERRTLEKQAARFQAALDSSSDAIFLIDPAAMRFIDANATACDSLGYTRAALLERGPHDIKPEFDRSSLRARFEGVLAGTPGSGVFETLHQRSDGSTFPVEVSLRPFESEGTTLMVVVARDFSARQLAESQLKETNERFRQFADNVNEVFWIRDLEANCFLYISPAFETLFRIPLAHAYRDARVFLDFVHPEDRDRVASAFDWQREHRDGVDLEYRIIVGDETHWLWVRTFPVLDEKGNVYRMAGVAEDITRRREFEAQYQTIIQTSMDGFLMADMRGRILDCNDAFCRTLGYTREEMQRLTIPELDQGKTPAEVEAHIRRVIEQGQDRFETQDRHKNGQLVDIEVSANYQPDASGGRLFSFIRDITQRKQAEHALRENEQRFRSLVANLPGLAYRCALDADWTVEVFSGEVEKLTGYPASDFLGRHRSYASIIHPDDVARVDRMVREAVAGKRPFEIDYRIRHADGRILSVHENGHAVFSDDGEVQWLDGFIWDVTQNQQFKMELLRREARTHSILRAAPVGIGVVVERVLVEINDAMTHMTGYAAEELMGRSARMLYPTQADFDYVGTEKYRQIAVHGIGSVETRWLRKDGRIIDVLLSSSPIVADDLSQGVTFTAMDITAAKQAEQNRLAHESDLRDALVREVHHRIKNNLQGVIGLLREHIAEQPSMESPIEAAIAQVNTVAVVHGLQSRIPENELPLCELLHEVVRAARKLAMASALPAIEDALNGDVWLDNRSAVTIALVLNELILNALKHGRHADGRGVEIVLSGDTQQAMIRISNPGRDPLPDDFDLTTGRGCGTGLSLVHTLLPTRGAELNLYKLDTHVVAELVLGPPVTSTHGHVARMPAQRSSQ